MRPSIKANLLTCVSSCHLHQLFAYISFFKANITNNTLYFLLIQGNVRCGHSLLLRSRHLYRLQGGYQPLHLGHHAAECLHRRLRHLDAAAVKNEEENSVHLVRLHHGRVVLRSRGLPLYEGEKWQLMTHKR